MTSEQRKKWRAIAESFDEDGLDGNEVADLCEAVPALLDEVERLTKERDEALAELERVGPYYG